jgi:hypothetical protein
VAIYAEEHVLAIRQLSESAGPLSDCFGEQATGTLWPGPGRHPNQILSAGTAGEQNAAAQWRTISNKPVTGKAE